MLCFILYKQGHFLDALFNILFSNCIFISRYKWFCIFELELVWKLREDSTPLIKHTLSSVMQLSFLSCFLQNNFQALCNKCAQCQWLEHLVTLCAIYKNLKPHLSWPSGERNNGERMETTLARMQWKATKKQSNFNSAKQTHYWWCGSAELQSLLFIGITNYRQHAGEWKCSFLQLKVFTNRKDCSHPWWLKKITGILKIGLKELYYLTHFITCCCFGAEPYCWALKEKCLCPRENSEAFNSAIYCSARGETWWYNFKRSYYFK